MRRRTPLFALLLLVAAAGGTSSPADAREGQPVPPERRSVVVRRSAADDDGPARGPRTALVTVGADGRSSSLTSRSTPSSAIAAATRAIRSGVATTSPWP
jgi:hypothetical protein